MEVFEDFLQRVVAKYKLMTWFVPTLALLLLNFMESAFHFILIILFQLPDKCISSLVKYYYAWKKTRNRTSLMDRQARRQNKDPNRYVEFDCGFLLKRLGVIHVMIGHFAKIEQF